MQAGPAEPSLGRGYVLLVVGWVLLVTAGPCLGAVDEGGGAYGLAIAHIPKLPDPPPGLQWAVDPDFTDEFIGETLDEAKWYGKSPYWTNGRPPATFKASNVSVEDGCLRIRNTRLDSPEGNDGRPGTKYSHAGGAVASRSDRALYGYYEVRMKASPTPMSSTFWLKNLPETRVYIDATGKRVTEQHRQELDIIETIGAPTQNPGWNRQFNANTHYQVRVRGGESPPQLSGPGPKDAQAAIEPTADGFHTYGCWWENASTLHFYYDGRFLFTIHPPTDYNSQPFARPMYMHLVTETYNWEPGLPTDEMLNDDSRNSTRYDWVRSYRLVRE